MIQAGDRFNRLVAVRREGKDKNGHTRWIFRCDCGNEKGAIASSVEMGRTKSCGCLRNSTGMLPVSEGSVFGDWTAVRFVGRDENSTNVRWLFRCSCGQERILIAAGVKYAGSKSCGCKRKPSKEKMRIDLLFKVLKAGAKRREIPLTLSKSDIAGLAERQDWKCVRTGIPLDITPAEHNKRKPFGPSVDRIDSNRGYEPGNIQLVCLLYNFCKNEYTDEDVLTLARALIEHNKIPKLRIVA